MRIAKIDVYADNKKSIRHVTVETVHDALVMYAGWDRVKNVEYVDVKDDSVEAGEARRNGDLLIRARKPGRGRKK